MIVIDTNVITYLLVGGEMTSSARAVFDRDSAWAAPLLWRSEFRNVMAILIRQGKTTPERALELIVEAELLFQGEEYQVDSAKIMKLVETSKCTAYDCEFVALAQHLGVPLITYDKQILTEFPDVAISIDKFGA